MTQHPDTNGAAAEGPHDPKLLTITEAATIVRALRRHPALLATPRHRTPQLPPRPPRPLPLRRPHHLDQPATRRRRTARCLITSQETRSDGQTGDRPTHRPLRSGSWSVRSLSARRPQQAKSVSDCSPTFNSLWGSKFGAYSHLP